MSSKKTAGAVHDAIRKGSLTEVKKCLKKGSSVNETNASKQTPLHTAAIEGQLTILLYLIEKKKCDVNAKDRDGWTPLHCACHSGHLEIVDQLISHDANLNFETSNGSMPLHYFVRMPAQSTRPALFERLFRTMIRKGVNINQQNQQGETPLHMAAFRGKEKSVALLLWNQADPNLKNKYGETPLHLAARAGYSNVLKQLLDVSADYNISGCNGTAYEIAINNNNQEMIAIFEEKMKPEDKILLKKAIEAKQKGKAPTKPDEREISEKTKSINDVVYAYPTDNTSTMNHLPSVPFVAPVSPTLTPPVPNIPPSQPPQGFYPFPYNGMPPTGQPPMPYYYPGYYPGGTAVFTHDPNIPFDPNNPNAYQMVNPNNYPPSYPMSYYPTMQINPNNDPNAHIPHLSNPTPNEVNINTINTANTITSVNEANNNSNNIVPQATQTQKHEDSHNIYNANTIIIEQPHNEKENQNIKDEKPREEVKPQGVTASNRSTLRKKTNTNKIGSLKKGNGGGAGGAKRNAANNKANNTPASFEPPKLENYHIGELIDRGAFGAVYRGLDIKTGAIVAIKQVPLAGVPPKELQTIMAELNLLKRLENKYIVRYIGFVQDEANINFVMEYIEGGSLSKLIQKFGKLPETLCAKYVSQVLLGLDYIHRRGVIHRDIKCANILITKDGTVKLADFGIAATPEGQEAEATLKTLKDGQYKNNNSNKEAVGSPYWMAPEIILLEGASTNSDIWSLGSTVIELVSGSPPYIDLAPMAALFAVVQDPHPPIPVDISNDLRDFLLLCFNKQPNERPTARELLKHPFIVNNVGDLSSELISTTSSLAEFPDFSEAKKEEISKPAPKQVQNKQQSSPKIPLKKEGNEQQQQQQQGAGKPTRAGVDKRRQSNPVPLNPPAPQNTTNPVKPPVKQQVAKVPVKQPVNQPANQPKPGIVRQQSRQGGGQQGGQGAKAAGGTVGSGQKKAPAKQGATAALNNNNSAFSKAPQIQTPVNEQDINSSIAELKFSADRTFRPYELDNLPTMTNINVTSILQSFSSTHSPELNMNSNNSDDKSDEDKTDEAKSDEDKTDEDKTDEDKTDDEEEEDETKMQLARTTKQLTELMKWCRSAMDSNQGARACKLRIALRKEKKVLRSRFRDFTEARELAHDIRKLCKECEMNFSDFISLDDSDTDYDSDDSFFIPDEEDEDDDEFIDGF